MKTHARLGADAIEQAESDIDHPVPFLQIAAQIARWHHERWDGQGYPDGLAGEAIPLAARLMAVADVFDSLVSPRVYKQPFSLEQARQAIIDGRATQFDPDVVDVFIDRFDDFVAVAHRHRPPDG